MAGRVIVPNNIPLLFLEFLSKFKCHPAACRPNCEPLFEVANTHGLVLTSSPSPFIALAWEALLAPYLGTLPLILMAILKHRYKIG